MVVRRDFLKLGGGALVAMAAGPVLAARLAGAGAVAEDAQLRGLEKQSGGRLGVCLWQPQTGARWGNRVDERFPMCSTFKFVLAAAVLARADAGQVGLDARIAIATGDLINFSPVTQRHVGKDLSVRDLCRATMTTSDNTAANLLLPVVGEPAGLTAFLRQQGDAVTQVARYEPEANNFALDDPRDTTSPAAMAANLHRFVLGNALSTANRAQLADWLIDNQTGDARLRAGLPASWRIGDKTGGNGRDTTNDIAVLWPDNGQAPWLLTTYLQGASVDSAARDDILRQVGQWARARIG